MYDMSRTPSNRIRSKEPGPLSDLLIRELDRRNLTYRDLAAMTEEYARKRDPDDEGVGMTVIGSMVRGETQEPSIRNLWLIGKALGIPLGDILMTLGYDPSDLETSPASVEQQQVIALIRGSGSEDLKRIKRTLSLDTPGKVGLDAFLTANEARLRQQDKEKRHS
jgi:transcriptional regulator with XRE-family HTH domain